MLSRTADSLFWLARHVERAENVARMVSVAHRMSSVARSLGGATNEWLSTLIATGCEPGFFAKYSEAVPVDVIDYLVRDTDNPSSIVSSLETARRNARQVRTALTADMWEALNATWLELQQVTEERFSIDGALAFFDRVKERSHLFRGVTVGTALKEGACHFNRPGTFLERAEHTSRILDVR